MSLPLRVAFLWHNHQPYYEKDGEFILPWVRLHAVKDYLDIPLILNEFPTIKQNYNIVPSLLLQLEHYLSGANNDIIQRLTLIQASKLSIEDKEQILKLFFLCNENNMIRPYSRYTELFEKSKQNNALILFSDQDWLDLQVWYNLAWMGQYSRDLPFIKRLFGKGKNYSETEKEILLDCHNEVMSRINKNFKRLVALGQVEMSVSPFYHPILPLLINTESSKEANHANPSVEPNYSYPQDANMQIEKAVEYFKQIFNANPQGMWPSEGSISNDAIELIANSGIKWIASDEQVMFNSETGSLINLTKYFPRKYVNGDKQITIFFRDHGLSDKIGFVYSNWNAHDAARDFVSNLLTIRNSIHSHYGDAGLKNAVVSIILDGENCWEYYPNNGIDFLRTLYSYLSITSEIKTINFSDALGDGSNEFLKPLNNIKAGSWIDANFNIWISNSENIVAWNMLSRARHLFEELKPTLSEEIIEQIQREILIAEGSDWFWWYYPHHQAENKKDFDILFRWHLKNIYQMMGVEIPKELYKEILSVEQKIQLPKNKINPVIDGEVDESAVWDDAGYVVFNQSFSTMHQSQTPPIKIFFGNDDSFLYFRIDNFKKNIKNNIISIDINQSQVIIQFDLSGITIKHNSNEEIDYSFALCKTAEISVPLDYLSIDESKFISYTFKLINLSDQVTLQQEVNCQLY